VFVHAPLHHSRGALASFMIVLFRSTSSVPYIGAPPDLQEPAFLCLRDFWPSAKTRHKRSPNPTFRNGFQVVDLVWFSEREVPPPGPGNQLVLTQSSRCGGVRPMNSPAPPSLNPTTLREKFFPVVGDISYIRFVHSFSSESCAFNIASLRNLISARFPVPPPFFVHGVPVSSLVSVLRTALAAFVRFLRKVKYRFFIAVSQKCSSAVVFSGPCSFGTRAGT